MLVHTCLSPPRLRKLTLAVVLAAGFGAQLDASPIGAMVYYQTDGTIGSNASGSPAGALLFTGASHATNPVTLPGTLSLGNFDVASLPASTALTAVNTPFHVTVNFGDQPPSGNGQSWITSKLQVDGVLNGTITGDTQSSMVATVTDVQQVGGGTLPFALGDLHILGPLTLTPYGQNPVKWPTAGGPYTYSLSSELAAQVSSINTVPEPTALAVLAVGLAGYALRKRARARVH